MLLSVCLSVTLSSGTGIPTPRSPEIRERREVLVTEAKKQAARCALQALRPVEVKTIYWGPQFLASDAAVVVYRYTDYPWDEFAYYFAVLPGETSWQIDPFRLE